MLRGRPVPHGRSREARQGRLVLVLGRADDVIKSAGHLIGPFEVESALMEHPAIAEAGVIGRPDPFVGAVVKAFPKTRSGKVMRRLLQVRELTLPEGDLSTLENPG